MIISYVFSRIIIKGNKSKIFYWKISLSEIILHDNNKDDGNEKVKSKKSKSKKFNNINDTSLKDEEKKNLKGAKIKNESESELSSDPTISNECINNNNNNNNYDDDNDEVGYQFITVPSKFKEYNSNEEENEVTDKDLKKPIPPTNLCCGSGCGSSCVWEVYFNEMDEYNKKLKKIDPNAKELPPDTSDDNEDPIQYFLKMERYNSMLQNKKKSLIKKNGYPLG
ncbi:hypothetical protein ACTFIY_001782 [Dictyostelium cf. discoideum]